VAPERAAGRLADALELGLAIRLSPDLKNFFAKLN
jgi:hypothetical protein